MKKASDGNHPEMESSLAGQGCVPEVSGGVANVRGALCAPDA
jgi:hypothetical protein